MAVHSKLTDNICITDTVWPHWFELSDQQWNALSGIVTVYFETRIGPMIEEMLSIKSVEEWVADKHWNYPKPEFYREVAELIDNVAYSWPLAARGFYMAHAMHQFSRWMAVCIRQFAGNREATPAQILQMHKQLGLTPKEN